MTSVLIFLVIVWIVAFWAMMAYNRLVALRHELKNAFAQIDVQLLRRYELIPNLVEATKAYLKHEKDTLAQVTAARHQAFNLEQLLATNVTDTEAAKQFMQAESQLQNSLGRLLAVAENYPDLKADATIAELMEDLRSSDNRVAFARQAFNDAVLQYNIAYQQFPTNLITGLFHFQIAAPLELSLPEARQPIRISLQ